MFSEVCFTSTHNTFNFEWLCPHSCTMACSSAREKNAQDAACPVFLDSNRLVLNVHQNKREIRRSYYIKQYYSVYIPRVYSYTKVYYELY